MITLHGFASSNYYNIAKYVLLYKEIPFEEHLIFSGGEEWLSVSPVGKVPALTTDDGQHISETTVICDYLEEVYPDKPLYSSDPVERAHMRQIMKIAELYLELPSRRLIGYTFSGNPAPKAVLADARQVTTLGINAMKRLCKFSPYIAGNSMTLADIYVHYVNAIVMSIGSTQMDWDIVAEMPGMKEWNKDMRDTEIAQSVEADRLANQPAFMSYIQSFLPDNTLPGK